LNVWRKKLMMSSRNSAKPLMMLTLWLIIIGTLVGSCYPKGRVVYVNDSEKVIFVEPNEPVQTSYKAVIISRGYFTRLIEFEMLCRQHNLVHP